MFFFLTRRGNIPYRIFPFFLIIFFKMFVLFLLNKERIVFLFLFYLNQTFFFPNENYMNFFSTPSFSVPCQLLLIFFLINFFLSLYTVCFKTVTKIIEYTKMEKKKERKKITKKTKNYKENEDRALLHNLFKVDLPSLVVL